MKKLLNHILIFSTIIVIVLAYNLLGISCLLRYIFHIPCPTCGMTRSMFSLLRLDFRGYIFYNPMTIPLLAVVFLYFHQGKNARFKKPIEIIMVVIAVIVFLVYLYRLYYNLIP